MARPISNPNTLIETGLNGMLEVFLRENFSRIAEDSGYAPGGGSGPTVIIDKLEDFELEIDQAHKDLGLAVKMMRRTNLYLYGPKGSGKSTMARQIAEALKVDCTVQGRCEGEYQLFGFRDAQGRYAETAFYRAFKFGGLFCLDELDRSDSAAIVALNDALASRRCTFPNGEVVEAAINFYFVGTGNTAMRGAERGFAAAAEQDTSVVDRLAFLRIDYDEDLERSLVPAAFQSWVKLVQAIRAAAMELHTEVDATPRASITGAKFIADGLTEEQAAEALIWRGLEAGQRDAVQRRAEMILNQAA